MTFDFCQLEVGIWMFAFVALEFPFILTVRRGEGGERDCGERENE